MEAMERKNGKIFDDSDSTCGEEHELYGETQSLSDSLEQNTRDNKYIWLSESTNSAKYL